MCVVYRVDLAAQLVTLQHWKPEVQGLSRGLGCTLLPETVSCAMLKLFCGMYGSKPFLFCTAHFRSVDALFFNPVALLVFSGSDYMRIFLAVLIHSYARTKSCLIPPQLGRKLSACMYHLSAGFFIPFRKVSFRRRPY